MTMIHDNDRFAAIAKVFVEIRGKKIDLAHRSDAVARLGSRELRAVEIPASYDTWRPPKRRKNDSEKMRFVLASEIRRGLVPQGV